MTNMITGMGQALFKLAQWLVRKFFEDTLACRKQLRQHLNDVSNALTLQDIKEAREHWLKFLNLLQDCAPQFYEKRQLLNNAITNGLYRTKDIKQIQRSIRKMRRELQPWKLPNFFTRLRG